MEVRAGSTPIASTSSRSRRRVHRAGVHAAHAVAAGRTIQADAPPRDERASGLRAGQQRQPGAAADAVDGRLRGLPGDETVNRPAARPGERPTCGTTAAPGRPRAAASRWRNWRRHSSATPVAWSSTRPGTGAISTTTSSSEPTPRSSVEGRAAGSRQVHHRRERHRIPLAFRSLQRCRSNLACGSIHGARPLTCSWSTPPNNH